YGCLWSGGAGIKGLMEGREGVDGAMRRRLERQRPTMAKPDRVHARPVAGLDVEDRIADHPGMLRLNPQAPAGLQESRRIGLEWQVVIPGDQGIDRQAVQPHDDVRARAAVARDDGVADRLA